MNKKKKNVPKIRFPGFTEEWQQRKLGEECQITMGQSPDGTTYSEVPSDYILVQGNADLKDGWVFPRIWTTQRTKSAQAGDLIMSVRAPAGAMGKTAYDVVLGRGVAGIKGNEFIYQTLVKMDSDGYWKKLAAGSTFASINSDAVKNAEILVPQDIEEQEKIGTYFQNLDNLITLHQRKLEHLNEMKKGLLQKMFPKKGEKVPEIRFPGFTDDWEQLKFSDIVTEKLTNGVMNQQTETVTDVKHINVINMYSPDRIHIDELTYSACDDNTVKKCNVEVGDIFLTRSSLKPEGIAEPNVLMDYGRFVFDDHLIRMKVDKIHYDPFFTKILLLTSNSKKQFISKSKQNAFTTIGQEDIANSEGLFPSIDEQKKIGNYFTNLDHLITLHQRKLDHLKEQKKGLLQQMFV